jgi:hypothetical protein
MIKPSWLACKYGSYQIIMKPVELVYNPTGYDEPPWLDCNPMSYGIIMKPVELDCNHMSYDETLMVRL